MNQKTDRERESEKQEKRKTKREKRMKLQNCMCAIVHWCERFLSSKKRLVAKLPFSRDLWGAALRGTRKLRGALNGLLGVRSSGQRRDTSLRAK